MKTVELIEIEKLYMDCHVEMVKNQPIRTSLNTGFMNNRNSISSNYNNTVLHNEGE